MSAPSVRLVLVRHAEHDISIDDGPLTALGLEQATALGEALRVGASDALFASPLLRARATASLIRDDYETVAGLEEFRFGPAAPRSDELIAERADLALWRATHRFPGGETLAGFQGRVADTLDSLATTRRGPVIVAVTHSGFIDAALRWAYGLDPDDDWMTEVELPNASVTEIEHWRDGRHSRGAPRFNLVRRVGDVSHLPPELVTEI